MDEQVYSNFNYKNTIILFQLQMYFQISSRAFLNSSPVKFKVLLLVLFNCTELISELFTCAKHKVHVDT